MTGGAVASGADPRQVALVLPGRAYSADMPLLYYLRALLGQRGWEVLDVSWGTTPPTTDDAVLAVADEALADVRAPRVLLVGKSLGTRAIPLAADRSLPGIWLTPLVTEPSVRSALSRLRAPALLVGGTADPSWDPAVRGLGHEVLEIDGGTHTLDVPGDVEASVAALSRVVSAAARFLDRSETAKGS